MLAYIIWRQHNTSSLDRQCRGDGLKKKVGPLLPCKEKQSRSTSSDHNIVAKEPSIVSVLGESIANLPTDQDLD